MTSKFNIPLTAERLTAYAIERQNGTERHQSDEAPPWTDQRRFWTGAILQGMARLEGRLPTPELMEWFDQRLESARGCFAVEPLPLTEQTALIRDLGRYISELEATGDDRRRQIAVAGAMLEDMGSHLPWDSRFNGFDSARHQAERALLRMTAKAPIRFTRILLGGEMGPCESGYLSGAVTDAGAVKETNIYEETSRQYPEVTDWPAICVVYAGGGMESAAGTVDATAFDLAIMNRAGDRFLREQGIRWLGGPYEMKISDGPQMNMMM